jgi:thiol-disulfide isomerase/thioredoxin
MAMLCICGVCIPYSAILPLLAFLFRYMAEPLAKLSRLIKKFLPWAGNSKDSTAKTGGDDATDTGKHPNSIISSSCCREEIIEETSSVVEGKKEVVTTIKSMKQWQDHHAKYETVICKFTATWCKPCKLIEPQFHLLAEEYYNSRAKEDRVSFVKVIDLFYVWLSNAYILVRGRNNSFFSSFIFFI